MAPRPLGTTHFALLSLLSIGPASAYELVRQMGRSVGHVWPRAQSNLYVDLKRLAADGLANASSEPTGRRPRTTYRITRAGRRALAEWLQSEGEPPSFECEALLKVAFAPSSTVESTIAQVDVIGDHARANVELGRRLATEYVEGEGPLPERLHVNAVMWRFLWEQNQAMVRWATWARAEIEQWDGTGDSPRHRRRGLESLRAGLRSGS